MNTGRRISCTEIFLQISVGRQQLSQDRWVAARGQKTLALVSTSQSDKFCLAHLRAARPVAAERLASRAEFRRSRARSYRGVEQSQRSDKFCRKRNAARPACAPSDSHQEQKDSKKDKCPIGVRSEATNFAKKEIPRGRPRAERLALGAERLPKG